jgi:hypothetical protein
LNPSLISFYLNDLAHFYELTLNVDLFDLFVVLDYAVINQFTEIKYANIDAHIITLICIE